MNQLLPGGLIRVGTLIGGGAAPALLPKLDPLGFESFGLTFWQTTNMETPALKELAKKVRERLDPKGILISSVGVFGNPLTPTDKNADCVKSWERVIDTAKDFGTDLVCGFAGRIVNQPIPDSMPAFKKTFGELSKRAKDQGVRIAFENCDMGGNWKTGDWNIAQGPASWEMMFNEVPMDNLGLEWEPCHQMVGLVDPIPQLRKWAKKVFHVHGKDATIAWDIVKEHGTKGDRPYVWHRTPGFGDSNWNDICTILMQSGYQGTIDIEGYHDPVHRKELELSGQLRGMKYLKECRGGDPIPSPF
jgi:sugar phosphate isomerase/epimerase